MSAFKKKKKERKGRINICPTLLARAVIILITFYVCTQMSDENWTWISKFRIASMLNISKTESLTSKIMEQWPQYYYLASRDVNQISLIKEELVSRAVYNYHPWQGRTKERAGYFEPVLLVKE